MSNALSDEQVIAERNDLEMLRRPHLWPNQQPGLRSVHVKKGSFNDPDNFQTGICFTTTAEPDKRIIMILTPPAGKNTRIEYPDPEHVTLDGWRVD